MSVTGKGKEFLTSAWFMKSRSGAAEILWGNVYFGDQDSADGITWSDFFFDVPPAAPTTDMWAHNYQDIINTKPVKNMYYKVQDPEVFALPQLSVPALSWQPRYSDIVPVRKRSNYFVVPDPFEPNIQAFSVPAVSWKSIYPDKIDFKKSITGRVSDTFVSNAVFAPAETITMDKWKGWQDDFAGRKVKNIYFRPHEMFIPNLQAFSTQIDQWAGFKVDIVPVRKKNWFWVVPDPFSPIIQANIYTMDMWAGVHPDIVPTRKKSNYFVVPDPFEPHIQAFSTTIDMWAPQYPDRISTFSQKIKYLIAQTTYLADELTRIALYGWRPQYPDIVRGPNQRIKYLTAQTIFPPDEAIRQAAYGWHPSYNDIVWKKKNFNFAYPSLFLQHTPPVPPKLLWGTYAPDIIFRKPSLRSHMTATTVIMSYFPLTGSATIRLDDITTNARMKSFPARHGLKEDRHDIFFGDDCDDD